MDIPVFFVGTLSASGCYVDRAIVGDAVLVRGEKVYLIGNRVLATEGSHEDEWQRLPSGIVYQLIEQVGSWTNAGQVIDALLAMCAESHAEEVTNVTSDSGDVGV